MNLQETIRRILKEETNPSLYVRRRMQCFDEFVNKLENDELDVPVIRNARLDWYSYNIILTAYMRNYCGEDGYYDEDIYKKVIDYYGDRLYKWFKKNID